MNPEAYGIRALAVLVQHVLKCAKTPQQFVTTTKIQARYVNDRLVNPLLISGFRDGFVQEYRSMIEKMPGNQKDLTKKIQFACGHLSEVGNLHARQNDRMLPTVILPGIGAISGRFASAFISGDSRNTSAINVVKSMTVQGMILYYYQLRNQGIALKKDFSATQKSILETIQRRAGSNGTKLVQAIEQENSSDLLIGLNKTIPVLMAGHGLMIEDILAMWLYYRAEAIPAVQPYIGYTKADANNGVTMFNSTMRTVTMTESNAYKYLFTKFALRGIGQDQFNRALILNCIETDWARMAVTAMNYRSEYLLSGEEVKSRLRIKKMKPFKTDVADLQKASEIIGNEQVVVRFDVQLEAEVTTKMEENRDYELVQEWTSQHYASFFAEEGRWIDGETRAKPYNPEFEFLESVVSHNVDDEALHEAGVTWIVDRR